MCFPSDSTSYYYNLTIFTFNLFLINLGFQANILKQNLSLNSQIAIDQQTEIVNELFEKVSEAQKQTKKGIKAQKVSIAQYFKIILVIRFAIIICKNIWFVGKF